MTPTPPPPPTPTSTTGRSPALRVATVASPVGELRVVTSATGVRAVLWPTDVDRVPLGRLEPVAATDDPVAAAAVAQLGEYFAGARTAFDLPLDLVGTPFQVAAWEALRRIPFGATRSYREQATAMGRPSAVRAVGAADGRNPVSIVVPCHRVVGASGKLTGFAGGLDAKRFLLDHERAVVAAAP